MFSVDFVDFVKIFVLMSFLYVFHQNFIPKNWSENDRKNDHSPKWSLFKFFDKKVVNQQKWSIILVDTYCIQYPQDLAQRLFSILKFYHNAYSVSSKSEENLSNFWRHSILANFELLCYVEIAQNTLFFDDNGSRF